MRITSAPHGNGPVRAAGRRRSARDARMVSDGLCRRLRMGRGAQHDRMSQFADGGYLASKPYAASGAYIDRMSDYCGACAHVVKQKAGPEGLPFQLSLLKFPHSQWRAPVAQSAPVAALSLARENARCAPPRDCGRQRALSQDPFVTRAARQRSEQYFTSSQTFSHFLRHTKACRRQHYVFCSRSDFLRWAAWRLA